MCGEAHRARPAGDERLLCGAGCCQTATKTEATIVIIITIIGSIIATVVVKKNKTADDDSERLSGDADRRFLLPLPLLRL